jgi:hypothetical protein
MKKNLRRLSLLSLAAITLAGCALTRVSDKRHAQDVEDLDAVGLTLEQARASATQKGFVCEPQPDRNRSVQTQTGVRKTDVLQCSKSSAQLICPQRRYVVFNIDPDSAKVYAVGRRITQQSCF